MRHEEDDYFGWLMAFALAFALLGMALLLGVPLLLWNALRRWRR
jgi:hypothetical protein